MAKVIFLIAAAVSLGGCAYLTARGQQFCTAASPIYPRKGDVLTKETLRLIVGHDNIGEKLCGWVPPHPEEDK